MTAIKAADVDAFIARPDPKRPVVLVFGPDAGLVSERVNALVKASVDDPNDPFALARLEGEDVAAEPSRLVEEAQTIPLFGGRRAVWVKAGSRNIAPAVEALLGVRDSRMPHHHRGRRSAPQCAAAGAVRARRECRGAAVLRRQRKGPRPADRRRDARRRPKLSPDARALLIPLLGGDRAASRNEIRKLALYAQGRNGSASTTSPRSCPTHRRWRSTTLSMRRSPAARRISKRSWPRHARRNIGRLDLVRRPAPGGAAAQMAHRHRSRRAVFRSMPRSRRCIFAARNSSKPRSSCGTPRGSSQRWPNLPTRFWNRGATTTRRDHRRARFAWRSP